MSEHTDKPSEAESLRNAANALLSAAQMLDHNDAIFKGKWKKGSKAWGGDFIERTIAEGLAHLGRTPPSAGVRRFCPASFEHMPHDGCDGTPANAAALLADEIESVGHGLTLVGYSLEGGRAFDRRGGCAGA